MSKSRIHIVLIVMLLLAAAVTSSAQTVASASDEPKLIAVLKSADASRRDKVVACRELAVIGTKDAVAALAALLGDEKLSHMARYGLEPIPDASVDEAFRAALGTLKGKPLVGVIGSVGVRRDAAAVGLLSDLLRQEQVGPEAKQAIHRALGSIGTVEASAVLKRSLEYVPEGRRHDLYEGLLRCAEHLAVEDHRDAATEIYDMIRAESNAPHQVRAGALRGAILVRGKNGVHLLAESLGSDDYIVFSAAVQASQEMAGSEVTQALTAALKTVADDNKILVMQTLGLRSDNEAVPALCDVAKSGSTPVRVGAIKTMAAIGVAYPVDVLIGLLDDKDDAVAKAALEALGSLPGKAADDAAVKVFGSRDADRQRAGLQLMGRRRMRDSVPMLFQAMGKASPEMRPELIKAVGDLGGPDQLDTLLDVLLDLEVSGELEAARQAIAEMSRKAEDPQVCSNQLIGRLSKAKPDQKIVLLRVLSGIGAPTALPVVRKAVDDSNNEVHMAAIRALGSWKNLGAAPYLLELAKDATNPNDRTLCFRQYLQRTRRQDVSVEAKLDMCRRADELAHRDDEKRFLLGTLGNIHVPETLEQTLAYLDDSAVRQEAALATLTVAERLLDKNAASAVGPLQKVIQADINSDLTDRAKNLLTQAKAKAGQ